MKSNALLKWLLAPMLLVVFIVIKSVSGGGGSGAEMDTAPRLTPEEKKALGVEADTPRDTVATLVGQVKQLRNELKATVRDNEIQRSENDRLRQREETLDQKVTSTLEAERQKMQADSTRLEAERQQTQGLLEELRERVGAMTLGGHSPAAELPVGADGAEAIKTPFDDGQIAWHEPLGVQAKNSAPAMSLGQKALSLPEDAEKPAIANLIEPVKPVYTLPVNATLVGSIAMTALIGRVPIDGTVNDPFPFKVVIGADNLTANGIDLPDVAGAVASGMASGDWTLSCVRGQIRSFTFVFNDGTIRTLPDNKGGGGSGGANQAGLGWISDESGVPCVSGERKSNAAQYLGTQSLLTAAGAVAASLIKSDSGRVTVNATDPVGTVGISTDSAMGRILAGGVQDMSQWVNKLYGQAFAAIYVPPAAKVAIHLDQPLTIDFDPKGRKVDHPPDGGPDVAQLD
ncbi:MAG: TIGR03752 family integrating conjugative element protein [Azoarcus sp.]|jgi:integrating conjugative element protein (TIGR03752 family)|nr:TIGR03752 family integrating conjugative element protein [Azoarcus sp.]